MAGDEGDSNVEGSTGFGGEATPCGFCSTARAVFRANVSAA